MFQSHHLFLHLDQVWDAPTSRQPTLSLSPCHPAISSLLLLLWVLLSASGKSFPKM